MTVRRQLAALAAAALVGAAGCGEDEEPQTDETQTQTQTQAEGAPSPDDETGVDMNTKPEVEVPPGDPPAKLETEDIKEGDGRVAKRGDDVTVHYVGVAHSTGEQFDASWDSGRPFPFRLGAGEVIPGWDQGVAGMKVGGRRRLVIPPQLAYGEQGFPPAIQPNETLVFVVDLLGVE